MTDVDSIITNVTVKDAPFEMQDSVIIAHLSRFGDLVAGSLQRGKIKGTNIDNGTRYIKVLNCVPVLPLRDQIGRYEIRLFADNNRTPCRHCNETSHPCFKCPLRDEQKQTIKCWQCGGEHHKKDCTEKKVCHFCKADDHLYNDCPKRLYGEYAADIIEGREAANEWSKDDATGWNERMDAETETQDGVLPVKPNEPDSEVDELLEQTLITPAQRLQEEIANSNLESAPGDRALNCLLLSCTNKVMVSDSNGCRLNNCIKDKYIHNISKSGAMFSDLKELVGEQKIANVDSVVVHLGTNDIKSNETAAVISHAINALECAQSKWPDAAVAYSSILPRVGKSSPIKKFNSDVKSVNNAILQYCQTSKKYNYLDNDSLFCANNILSKKLYDSSDPSGIHINEEGAGVLYSNILSFFEDGMSDENDLELGRSKRLRSDDSVTSQDLRVSKQGRNDKIQNNT